MADEEYQVRSVNRAIDILERLAAQPGLTLTQLASTLEMPKSTCFNILQTLVARGLLTESPDTGRFRLGATAIRLGGACLDQLDVRQTARPVMERLSTDAGETVILAVMQEPNLDVIYIDKVVSSKAVVANSDLGRKDKAYCTALGKAMLAWLPSERLERYLRSTKLVPVTPRTVTSPGALREQLSLVRAQGWAINDGELDNEGGGVAAPIFDHTGQAVAAISLAVPRFRMSPDRLQGLTAQVLTATREISFRLGAPA